VLVQSAVAQGNGQAQSVVLVLELELESSDRRMYDSNGKGSDDV